MPSKKLKCCFAVAWKRGGDSRSRRICSRARGGRTFWSPCGFRQGTNGGEAAMAGDPEGWRLPTDCAQRPVGPNSSWPISRDMRVGERERVGGWTSARTATDAQACFLRIFVLKDIISPENRTKDSKPSTREGDRKHICYNSFSREFLQVDVSLDVSVQTISNEYGMAVRAQ